jgi:GAF domain-containing protein
MPSSAISLQLLAGRASVLELSARGRPIEDVLRELCLRLEKLVSGAVAGVCILDRSSQVFETAIFPSLPESFGEGIKEARVAQKPGSCALAIYDGAVVTSEDLESDERFQDAWRRLSLDHGMKSIQSWPVLSPAAVSLGTFVLGFRKLRSFGPVEQEIAAAGAELAGIALTRHREEQLHSLVLSEM